MGIALVLKAWTVKVEEHLVLDSRARNCILPLGRIGFVARGLVFLTIGFSLFMPRFTPIPRRLEGSRER